MSNRNKIHLFPDYTVKVELEDITFESQLTFICCSDFAFKVLSPAKYKNSPILSPHVPYFAKPTINGYLAEDKLTQKFHDYCQWLHKDFYEKHKLFEKDLEAVKEYVVEGCTEDDIRGYFTEKYDVMYDIDELPYYLKFYKILKQPQ